MGNVPIQNYSLFLWVKVQRREYKKYLKKESTGMTDKRFQSLKKMGFVFDSLEHSWQKMFQQLKEYVERHGDGNVPTGYKGNPILAIWVRTQRKNYKLWMQRRRNVGSSGLNPERIKRLEALGFVWNVWDARWKERFEELVDFIDMNGHSDVTHANKILRSWVQVQRYHYSLWKKGEKSGLTQERREMLDKIGFDWIKKKSY